MSLKAKIEAVIYASEEPVTLAQLVGLLGQEAEGELERTRVRQETLTLAEPLDIPAEKGSLSDTGEEAAGHDDAEQQAIDAAGKRAAKESEREVREFLRGIVDQLIADYASAERGLELREVAGGYRLATKPEYHDAVRGFVKSLKPPLRLTLQALETLAVVAYKQPVTAPEISEIRGVDSAGVLGSLLARKLITTAGRKQVIGRPILYKTTKDFLLRFGLKDVAELPSIEEFEKMAGELAAQEEIPMAEGVPQRMTHEELEAELNGAEPQADGNSDDLDNDDNNVRDEAMPVVDGRVSGVPPRSEQPGDDPSADEAAVQSGEGEGV